MKTAVAIRCVRLILLAAIGLLTASTVAAGPLSDHPSPYLRLHADDAVHWQPWSREVLQQARDQNKLLFISIGYFACHWCHVMREESFDDDAVAAVLNSHFIPVKVDRELNPALDDYLMTFVQMTRGHGGWPLNVFVTPDGHPLTGMLYMPRDDFLRVITNLQSDWNKRQPHLEKLAREAFEFSRSMLSRSQPMPETEKLRARLLDQVRSQADMFSGGIGDQSKFPRPPLLMALLDIYARHPQPWLKDFLRLTLDQMASGGLHDVIGGGFFRYTVDPQWHTPHYEKMLYTNAGLARVYARASVLFDSARYRAVAVETVTFMIRDMWSPQGFISALSAQDRHGIEGGAYLWSMEELKASLSTQQWENLRDAWSFLDLEGGILPVGVATGSEWRDVRRRLKEKQRRHGTPRDEKVLPSWNGYALSALAAVARISERDDIRRAGERLYRLLAQHLPEGPVRTAAGVQRRYLEDHALMLQGMLDWAALTDRDLSAPAGKLLNRSLERFATEGGWRLSDARVLPMPADSLNVADAQLPSPEIVLLGLIRRLKLTDVADFRRYLNRFDERVDHALLENPLAYASHVAFAVTRVDPEKTE